MYKRLMKITWKRGLMKGSPPGPSLALLAESPVAKSADPKKNHLRWMQLHGLRLDRACCFAMLTQGNGKENTGKD